MKKWSLKKRIIFISAIVVIIGALVYPTYKLVKYVRYVDSYGADTMEEAAKRYVEAASDIENIKVHYPSKIFKKIDKDTWIKYYEDEDYLDVDDNVEAMVYYYGYKEEVRNVKLTIENITDEEKQEIIVAWLDDLIDNGAKIEESYKVTINCELRWRFDYDENQVEENPNYTPNGKWNEWKDYKSSNYMVYRIGHKWYIADVLSTL